MARTRADTLEAWENQIRAIATSLHGGRRAGIGSTTSSSVQSSTSQVRRVRACSEVGR